MKKIFFLFTAACMIISIQSCKKSPDSLIGKELSVNAKTGLKIRQAPASDAKMIDLITLGAKVTVIEESKSEVEIDGIKGRWVKIKFKEITGWAFSGYLSGDTGSTLSANEQQYTGYWKGKWSCEQPSHLQINPDKTFSGYIFDGGEMEGCSGRKISGTWSTDSAGRLAIVSGQDSGAFWIENGKLTTDEENGKNFKENFLSELIQGWTKK